MPKSASFALQEGPAVQVWRPLDPNSEENPHPDCQHRPAAPTPLAVTTGEPNLEQSQRQQHEQPEAPSSCGQDAKPAVRGQSHSGQIKEADANPQPPQQSAQQRAEPKAEKATAQGHATDITANSNLGQPQKKQQRGQQPAVQQQVKQHAVQNMSTKPVVSLSTNSNADLHKPQQQRQQQRQQPEVVQTQQQGHHGIARHAVVPTTKAGAEAAAAQGLVGTGIADSKLRSDSQAPEVAHDAKLAARAISKSAARKERRKRTTLAREPQSSVFPAQLPALHCTSHFIPCTYILLVSLPLLARMPPSLIHCSCVTCRYVRYPFGRYVWCSPTASS